MAYDQIAAAVGFGQWAMPRLARELRDPDPVTRQRALAALCDLVHNPERIHEAVSQGFMEQLKFLLKDEDPSIKMKTTEVLYVLAAHSIGSQLLCSVGTLSQLLCSVGTLIQLLCSVGTLSQLLCTVGTLSQLLCTVGTLIQLLCSVGTLSQLLCTVGTLIQLLCSVGTLSQLLCSVRTLGGSLTQRSNALLSWDVLSSFSELLDEPFASYTNNIYRVLNRMASVPQGAEAIVVLDLVPRLMMRVSEEEEEEMLALLLSTISCCVSVDARPALACNGVLVLGRHLSHSSPHIRREAAAAMMAISVSMEGKQKVCEEAILPVLVNLLSDRDAEVQANAAGAIMFTAVITKGKFQCVELGVLPLLLGLVSKEEEEEDERRKWRQVVTVNSLRALTCLAEVPAVRPLLREHLPLLRGRTGSEEDEVVRRAAETAIEEITWTP
ncbi:radial spoke head 14 homolog [Diretmus argenteus]